MQVHELGSRMHRLEKLVDDDVAAKQAWEERRRIEEERRRIEEEKDKGCIVM